MRPAYPASWSAPTRTAAENGHQPGTGQCKVHDFIDPDLDESRSSGSATLPPTPAGSP
jgi:hypothetical protein